MYPLINQIGEPLLTYQLNIRRRSKQGIIIEWFDDIDHMDPSDEITGVTMSIVVGHRDEPVALWPSVVSGNEISWNLTEEDTDFALSLYQGCIVMTNPDLSESVLMALRVVVSPPE